MRGPLSLQDVSAFLVGTGRSSAHGVLLREALRHPDHFFRNPEAGGGLEYTGIGHLRDSVAEAVGVPGAYDYGPQRVSWMGTLVTNWMGDDAFLKRLRVECRRFNVYGDTQWCKGRVIGKRVHDGAPLVDLEIWAENQRGEVTAPGQATVMLPSRDPRLPWFTDGHALNLRDAAAQRADAAHPARVGAETEYNSRPGAKPTCASPKAVTASFGRKCKQCPVQGLLGVGRGIRL